MSKRRRPVFRRRMTVGAQPGTLHIAEGAQKPSFHIINYKKPDITKEFDVNTVEELKPHLSAEGVTWIDVRGMGDEAVMRELAELFEVHPLSLEAIVNVPQRPRLESGDKHLLIIMRMLRVPDGITLSPEQVSVLVTEKVLVTIQERSGDVFEPVRARIRKGGPVFRSFSAEYLAYALMDAVIDGYYPVLEEFGERLEELERRVILNPQPSAVERIHHIKRELLAVRRAVWPQREVISSLLQDDLPYITERVATHLRDCYDHCVQVIDVMETYRELAGGLMDAYMSSVANRQNEVMKTLTIMASIFIPLGFLAGVYGMNFENMPELKNPWGYPVLIIVMATLAGGMVTFFWKRGWLGSGKNNCKESE